MTFFPILGASHLPRTPQALVEGFWPLLPALSLSLLFLSSTMFTETISGKKYPEYRAYQDRVGMFWPLGTYYKGLVLASKGTKGEIERRVWGPVKGKRIE